MPSWVFADAVMVPVLVDFQLMGRTEKLQGLQRETLNNRFNSPGEINNCVYRGSS